jgi:hypothetical protein
VARAAMLCALSPPCPCQHDSSTCLLCERRGRAGAAEARYVCARGPRSALKCSGNASRRVLLGSAGSNTDLTALFDTVKHPAAAV